MYYYYLIVFCIPVILIIITILFYWPLVIEYFHKKKSISYKQGNKHQFFILLILIVISSYLSYLICNNIGVLLSWVFQIIILIVFYHSIDLKFDSIKKYIKGENVEFEINKSNNDLSEEFQTNFIQIKESLSEEIKLSASDIIQSSDILNDDVIKSINNKSSATENILSETISNSSKRIKNEINKFTNTDFYIRYKDIFREINEELFEYHFSENKFIKNEEDRILFYNLVCNNVEPDRKINFDVRKNESTNVVYYKKNLALFLNIFFRIKELIDEFNYNNEDFISFLNNYFSINEGQISFHVNDFTRNLK